MVARGIHDVQLMDFAPDSIQFPVKVFYRWRVRVLEFAAQKPRHEGRLPNTRRPEAEGEERKELICEQTLEKLFIYVKRVQVE